MTKNICELYGTNGYIRTAYSYTPYGEITESANEVYQPIQWSSEYNDTELGLVYYNYRHYNPVDGRWIGRDYLYDSYNDLLFNSNHQMHGVDVLGLLKMNLISYKSDLETGLIYEILWQFQLDKPAKERLYIVQHIQKIITIYDCNTYREIRNKELNYFEAWLVYKNDLYPNTRGNYANENDVYYDDMWYYRNNGCVYGEIKTNSSARVYSRSRTGNLGDPLMNTTNGLNQYNSKHNKWKEEYREPNAHDLASTTQEPLWWGQPSSFNESTVNHSFHAAWDLCSLKTRDVSIEIDNVELSI